MALSADRFQRIERCPLALGTGGAAWLRLDLPSAGGPWSLALQYALIEELDLFLADSRGGGIHLVGGLARPSGARDVEFRAWGHVATLPTGGSAWLRVATRSTLLIDANLLVPGEAAGRDRAHFLFYGLDVAVLLGLSAVNLLRFLRRRDRLSLFVGVVTLSFGVFETGFRGLLPWLLPLEPWMAVAVPYLASGTAFAAGLLAAGEFLDLRQRHSSRHRLVGTAAVAAVAAGVVSAASPVAAGWVCPTVAIGAATTCLAVLAPFLRTGTGEARLFASAWAGFLVVNGYFSLAWMGVVPLPSWVLDAMRVAFWLGALVLTDALRAHAEFLLRLRSDAAERGMAQSREEARQARASQERTERDRERLTQELRVAQKLEAIGRLAGGVAHDFNNILTVVSTSLPLLEEDLPPGSEGKAILADVRDAVQRANAMTSRLLAFGSRQPLHPRVIDLAMLLDEMQPVLARLLGEDLALHLELRTAPVWVRGDHVQLEQVILNLVTNARDALQRGGTVVVSVGEGRGGGERTVLLRVQDDGPGIPADILPNIFEPFFTTKPQGKGTGLGLATTYGIIRQHGGTIEVYSEPGRGARFDVVLPAAVAPEPRGDLPTASPEVPVVATGTVLLVEDELLVAEAVARLLRRIGYEVVAVSGAAEALDVLRDRSFDLLLTDLVMPGCDGLELVDRARALRPDLPVLLMSGYSHDLLARRGLAEHHLPLLKKPFTQPDLARGIAEALRPEARVEFTGTTRRVDER